MELIVFSSPDKLHSEISHATRLFEEGLTSYHLRKPKFSTKKLAEYIEAVPEKYRDRIIIHSHHKLATKYKLKGIHLTRKHRKKKLKLKLKLSVMKLKHPKMVITSSCHSMLDLLDYEWKPDYVFLSPVFDSISKQGYGSSFSEMSLRKGLKKTKHKVIALGGVDAEKVERVKAVGFGGLALLGALWKNANDPLDVYKAVQSQI
jgi:thiamine monophosphate synthase